MPLSFVQYPGDGVTETFAVPFPYLRQEDIEARVNLDVVPITFDDPQTVRISPAPALDTVVEIRRSTKSDEPLVNFVDASILTETDLNLIVRQTFFIVQEAIDIAGGTLVLKANGAYGAGGRRLEDLADPVFPQDAVNKRFFEGTFLPQLQALLSQTTTARNQSEGFRNETQTFRNAAQGFRNEAETFRNAALGFRNEAETFRSQAQTSEQNAATSASTATTRRNEAEVARDAAQVAQGVAEGARDQGLIYRDATLGFRNEAEVFRNEAQQFRNEAQTFDPNFYWTKGEADGRFAPIVNPQTSISSPISGITGTGLSPSRILLGGSNDWFSTDINIGVSAVVGRIAWNATQSGTRFVISGSNIYNNGVTYNYIIGEQNGHVRFPQIPCATWQGNQGIVSLSADQEFKVQGIVLSQNVGLNLESGNFIAPVTGMYFLYGIVTPADNITNGACFFRRGGVEITTQGLAYGTGFNNGSTHGVVFLNQGDTVEFFVRANNVNGTIHMNHCSASVMFLG